jgi:AAA family ATPase
MSFCLHAETFAHAKQVPQDAFLAAARSIRKQITPDVIAHFERWRRSSGLSNT